MDTSDTEYGQVKRQLERLQNENRRLSEQVKSLFRAEYDLGKIQGQLDTQIRLYRQLCEVGNRFNATLDAAEILHMATEFVLYELNFERCLVLLRSDDGQDFRVQALDGYYDEGTHRGVANLRLSAEDSTLVPMRSGSRQVMCTAECDQQHLLELGRAFGMIEYVMFPLGGEPRNPAGLLIAGNTADKLQYHTRVQPDSEFVVGLANLVSMATTTLNNVDLYASLASLHEERMAILRQQLAQVTGAQEGERRRIARELHDGVGPALASLNIRLRTVHKLLERDRHQAADEIEDLARQAQAGIQDIRRLIHDLRPAALDELGLVPALREYVVRYQQEQDVEVALALPEGDERLPPALETGLFRIVQEALANVAKHARARRVEVVMTRRRGEVSLHVADDGQGFDPQAPRSGTHLGLRSMRERVEQLGGQFETETAPGAGATVRAVIPLRTPE
jgi:signal transduction histidine kinase